ncbi:MAG: membrane protein of unknown function [Promethearchaeota archaeon]|nr:MAG: membrane protein of unknown function [Candidatus Lokiarchaeota archaeon]
MGKSKKTTKKTISKAPKKIAKKTSKQASKKIAKTKTSIKEAKDKSGEKLRSFKDKYIFHPIYVKGGADPPKSFAFKKKFFGLYILFGLYSFILLWAIDDPNHFVVKLFTLGDPFYFGNALCSFFVTLALVLNNDKIRYFLFENHSVIKQIIIYPLILAGLYILFFFTSAFINYVSYLLALSLIWIILLSSRYYMFSRKMATKIEYSVIKKYSVLRNLVVSITPIIILIVLVTISFFYRGFLVILTLDFLSIYNPFDSINVYNIEMEIIMPFIYFSLIMTFVFIIFEFVISRSKLESKRAGKFDNFTFSLIVFFIFFYQLLQVTIFLIVRPETVAAIKSAFGSTGSSFTYIFIIEYAVSLIFLYRVIKKLGDYLEWRILFFKRDGLILFFLGCVTAQTLTRYALTNIVLNQEITLLGDILLADKYLISIFMIMFLGVTLLLYYMKPQETSMFIRMQKETVSEEDKSMNIVHDMLKSEYIRRGEAYPIEILERELIRSTKLSKSLVYSLIRKLADNKVDMTLNMRADEQRRRVYWIEFRSITDTYEKKKIANQKAKKFLSEKLLACSLKKPRDFQIIIRRLAKKCSNQNFWQEILNYFEVRVQNYQQVNYFYADKRKLVQLTKKIKGRKKKVDSKKRKGSKLKSVYKS